MTKPLHLAELLSRIKALGRSLLEFGQLTIDLDAQIAQTDQGELDLTKKEFQLLRYFMVNANKVLTRKAIAEHLWGDFMESAINSNYHETKPTYQSEIAGGGTAVALLLGGLPGFWLLSRFLEYKTQQQFSAQAWA